MKLTELLSNITPLPWNEDTPFASRGDQYWADQSYRHHAANVLPECVEFLRFIASLRKTGSGWIVSGDETFRGESNRVVIIDDVAEKAKALLDRAVEVEFPAVPRPSHKKTIAVSETATAGPSRL